MRKLEKGHPPIMFQDGDKVVQLSDLNDVLTIDGNPNWEKGNLYLRYGFKECLVEVFEQYLRKII